MNKNLGNAIFANIEQNSYLQKLYSTIFNNYALKVFNSRRHQPTDFNLDDALRFADLLSKSAGQDNSDKHRLWAQEIVTLLNFLYPEDEQIKYYMSSVLANTSNFRGLELIKSNYTGEDFLNKTYNSYTKEMLSVPGQENQHFFFTQKNVFDNLTNPYFSYSGPTSMGKSYVIRMHIKNRILNGKKSNFAILVPTKALITEVSSKIIYDLQDNLKDKNYRLVNSAGATALEHEHNFIFVVTPERMFYLLLSHPEINIDFLFVDEAHKISSSDKRSAFYYKIIKLLSSRYRKPNIIFASPNIPNPEVYLKLIPGIDDMKSYQLATSYSPVSQLKFVIDLLEEKVQVYNSLTKKLDPVTEITGAGLMDVSELVNLLGKGKQNIIYCASKKAAVNHAKKFAKNQQTKFDKRLSSLAKEIKDDVHGDYYLAELIEKGVAYHIGYLPTNIRVQIEELFRDQVITSLFCTNTLVEGVNLPADNLFVSSAKKGNINLDEVEFNNVIGRVGRIEYNLYGNVFLIRDNKRTAKDRYENLLSSDVKEQKLSVATELSAEQKQQIVATLESGSVEFPRIEKGKKKQSDDSYDLMRKFGLMLLQDIESNRPSLILEEFTDVITPESYHKIQQNFIKPNLKVNDDITVSYDQIGSLEEEIANGLSYPFITETESDYNEVLEFLNKLSDIFKWGVYERDTIGNPNKRKYYAVILLQWMQGHGLSTIIRKAISYKEEHPDTMYINFQKTRYDHSKEHKNIIIGDTLDDIDRIILFKFANYFLKFSTESKEQSGKKDLANDWYEYVEYGTMNQLSILLQKSGFSRETASFIKKNKNEFISESEGIMHLSPTLLNCDDSIVQREAKEIWYNAPELFAK